MIYTLFTDIIRGYIIHGFTVQFMLDRALSVMYALCTYLSLVPKEKFGEYWEQIIKIQDYRN